MALLLTNSSNGYTESPELSIAHDERRRGLRIAQDRPIKVFGQSAQRYLGGRTLDVSSTGLRVELPASSPIRDGESLSVHVGITSGGQSLANRRHMIPARVVWINRQMTPGEPPRLTAGLEFVASISARLDAA